MQHIRQNPSQSKGRMQGKICLITGATQGIGKATALGLAQQGATVALVGRDAGRTQATADEIRQACSQASVETFLADLSLQSEVRRLAAEVKHRFARLDLLVNNAGAIFQKREVTAEGFEKTWALNHLAYFLLTQELLERLKASAPARIVNVSSDAHRGLAIDFDDLQGKRRYSAIKAYAQSKLANVMFTYALDRRLEGTGVTANCLHPGAVATGFGHNMPGLLNVVMTLLRPLLLSAEKGAETSIYVASAPELAGFGGKYFEKCRAVDSARAAYDVEAQERLWRLSLEQLASAPVDSQ